MIVNPEIRHKVSTSGSNIWPDVLDRLDNEDEENRERRIVVVHRLVPSLTSTERISEAEERRRRARKQSSLIADHWPAIHFINAREQTDFFSREQKLKVLSRFICIPTSISEPRDAHRDRMLFRT